MLLPDFAKTAPFESIYSSAWLFLLNITTGFGEIFDTIEGSLISLS